ncbi:uncharacterized protein ATC70_012862 [Mucor velutinosus]|uniref:Uncharacterized protein n=1 Tax=Mucor velutinosus TaxID=708070 RepID=A0AAN7DBN9_9FUNG|nr:hypothetical protein ATC70_012862 [Mucor velutinosus]
MSLSERDEETTFIPPQPLVSDAENNRRYILHLSDNEDGEVDPIEKMYGPFEDALDTVPPYPKPYARLAKTAERIREEEILKLREAIRDMEQQRAQNMERKKLKEIEKEWKAVEGSRLRRTRISFAENRERLKALSEPIVIESDTDDAMEVEAVTDSVAVAESSEIQESEQSAHFVSSAEDEMQLTTDNNEDSDNDSFQTAQDAVEDIDPEMQMMKDDAAKIEKEVHDLNKEMEARVKQKEDIKLKLLGIKVKISIEKNRKELTGKRAATQASSSPPPKLGMKRAFTDENYQTDQHPWRPAQPANNTPLVPTQPMAFSQQIPPLMQQHFAHPPPTLVPIPQQPVPYHTGYDATYMNGLSPPPPPPNTMPPPYIPPPPPPPLSDTMSSAYPLSYSNHKRFKRNNANTTNKGSRHKDAWHTTPKRFTAAAAAAAVASPYADLNSPISRMENADEVQNALAHLSDSISVRVFGDKKHNAYSAHVERNLPRIRRLVTQGKRTFAAPVNEALPGNKTNNHLVFLSPAGLPAQLQITDASHESPFLGLLYRRYQEKPFHSTMEFTVPSIFSWIPQDVDLSTLYSNEFEGIPLYADKLTETYNMVCDLSSAYPGTEFLGALKLELSMYVNGRESETFMRDCQDCVAQYKDSIDVFWQIVLAEPDRSKQISLIQNHLKSIKVSSDTVTMVISEKTTEILIRTLRLFGLGQVLNLVSDGKITRIDESEGGIVLLDQIQYVNDDGKYFICMSILHYYVTHTLPEDVCDIWISTLVKDGSPSREKPLFTIDWANALKKHPVDGPTLRGATNMLLSMLRYFGNVAIGNVNKKPLLIGVLSTLFSFLSCTKCYDLIGTLVLTQVLDSSDLARDVEDIKLDLKSKTDT